MNVGEQQSLLADVNESIINVRVNDEIQLKWKLELSVMEFEVVKGDFKYQKPLNQFWCLAISLNMSPRLSSSHTKKRENKFSAELDLIKC